MFAIPGTLHAYATKYEGWQTIIIPTVCTFQIPPTMEIQMGFYKKTVEELKKTYKLPQGKNQVIAQQKGLNELNDEALNNRYARIIVSYADNPGDEGPNLGEKILITQADLKEIDTLFREQAEQRKDIVQIISWDPIKILCVNGNECIANRYRRKGHNGNTPVLVYSYIFFNKDRSHNIQVSYREKEASIWKKDLDKVINTFEFTKR